MASEIIVQTIKGPTSGANANKIIVPSGQTLDASEGFIPPAGSILQTESDFTTSEQTFSSSSYAGTGVSVTLTPKSTSSKFAIFASGGVDTSASDGRIRFAVFRDSTNLANGSSSQQANAYLHVLSQRALINFSIVDFDEPNTTSSITYELKGALGVAQSGTTVKLRGDTADVRLVVMEIAG